MSVAVDAQARAPLRRGACPGLSAPMRTGDGLLARLRPNGTMTLEQMSGLCTVARRHGNGIVEITSRGSIQVRGLTESSAPNFANDVAQLGIAAHDGVPVITDPLAGLDPDELIDARTLAAELRETLAARPIAQLAPKISIAIDGGGALHLAALVADIRLRAVGTPDDPHLHVAIGGNAVSAVAFGIILPTDAVDTVVRLLGETARHGPAARARDIIRAEATDTFRPPPRAAADPIGVHPLRDGARAVGVGFAFGHSDATALNELVGAARDAGAFGLRTSPDRALLVLGVAADLIAQFVDKAASIGFIIAPDDPRRRVVACAGAPVCASGEIPARRLAPQIAESAASLLARGEVIHISGCAKGCAHHGTAAFTAIGRAGQCDLLVDGALAGSCTVTALPQRLAALATTRSPRRG